MTGNEPPNQDVSAALELLNATLAEEKQRIYDAGAASMKKQDGRTARAALDFAEKLEDVRSDVQAVEQKWNDLLRIRENATPAVQEIVTGEGRLFSSKPRKIATGFTRKVSHPLARKKIFSIAFSDGTVIAEPEACETLCKAIAKLGTERVSRLNLLLCGEPLVGTSRSVKYPSSSKRIGRYYVLTQSSTGEKVKLLRRILKELSVDAELRIYEAPMRTATDTEI